MTQNIEQRTEAAVKKYETASDIANKMANTDSDVETDSGVRKSFLKIAREQEQGFQDRFVISSEAIQWAAGLDVTSPLQRYSAGNVDSEQYKEYLPNPEKLPFQTSGTIDTEIANGYWVEYWIATRNHLIKNRNQTVNGQLFPQEVTKSAAVSTGNNDDVSNVLAGTTHLHIEGAIYKCSPSPVSGSITALVPDKGIATIGGVAVFLTQWTDDSVNEVPLSSFLTNGNSHLNVVPHPAAKNPVLTKEEVTDRPAQGVADPFICHDNGKYHMFFEVITADAEEIGHAESVDGLEWTYTGVVLTEPGQHFAYPFVMKHKGEWYMIPDKGSNIDVYKATNFPSEWVKHKTLISQGGLDSTLFRYENYWYMHAKYGSAVNLYYTDDWLDGVWQPHPNNPMLSGAYDRGAGRAFVYDDAVVLPIQGYGTRYGEWADWFVLTDLSPSNFTITKSSRIFNPHQNSNWNGAGMHHIDHIVGSDKKIMVVDGISGVGSNDWSIGVYTDGGGEGYPIMGSVFGTQTQAVTSGVWTVVNLGSIGSRVSFDTNYMWDKTETHYTINKSGYYRLNAQVMEYGITGYRNIRGSIYNKTTAEDIVYSNETVPSEAYSSHGTTIQLSRTVYLNEGEQIDFRFYSTLNTVIDIQYSKTFFELEFVCS